MYLLYQTYILLVFGACLYAVLLRCGPLIQLTKKKGGKMLCVGMRGAMLHTDTNRLGHP